MSKAYASFTLDELVPQVADVNAKANSTALAEAYDPEKSSAYAVGDYCTYQGDLYKCTTATANPPGVWNEANWESVAVTDEMVDSVPVSVPDYASVAADFSTSKKYSINNIVKYGGSLYRCTTAVTTPGSWDSSKWTAITTADVTKPMRNVWYGKCLTSYNDATKLVSTATGDFVLEAGNIIVVYFDLGLTTSTCLLNVDGTGAKAVRASGSTDFGGNSIWSAGQAISFVYDGTYFKAISLQPASLYIHGVVRLSSTVDNAENRAATPKAVNTREAVANKVTAFSSPTDTQYPSAKLVSDQLALKADATSLASAFEATTYVADDFCTYNGRLYKCLLGYTATSSDPTPDSDTTHWDDVVVTDEIGGGGGETRYTISTPAQTSSGTTVSLTLYDHAINQVSLASMVTDATISFPAKTAGYARDFFVRLTITGSTVPAITWQEANGDPIDFDVDDDSWAEIEQGVNILMFTETSQASSS